MGFKVVRLLLYFSPFTFRIEHVYRNSNIWPDIMTRCLNGYCGVKIDSPLGCISESLPLSGVTEPPEYPEFFWPQIDEIQDMQTSSANATPKSATRNGNGLLTSNDKISIPDSTTDLKLRLLAISHAGDAGHHRIDSPRHDTLEQFTWTDLQENMHGFISSSLLYGLSKSRDHVSPSFSPTAQFLKSNKIIHFDYLFLRKTETDDQYVLFVKEDFRGYYWLKRMLIANANHSASVLTPQDRVFTTANVWALIQGSQFNVEVMTKSAQTLPMLHKFTVFDSPWSNGTVESLMRFIISASRAILANSKLVGLNSILSFPLI